MTSGGIGSIRGQIRISATQALAAYASVRRANAATRTALLSASAAFTRVGVTALAAAAPIALLFKKAVSAAADFEKKIDYFGAVTDATEADMQAVADKAIQMSKTTVFSASDMADAFVEFGKAGISTRDILNGVADATANLAQAADISMGEASNIMASQMATFSLGAEQAGHVADVLAGAANASIIDVQDLAYSLKYAGGIAASTGVSFDSLVTAISLLGQRGIKGSTAGTSLRQIMVSLTTQTKQASKQLKKLGIITKDGTNLFIDREGKIKSLAEVMQILQDHERGLTQAEQLAANKRIFNSRALSAVQILMKDGVKGFADMQAAINKVTASDVAHKRLDNLAGDWQHLKNSIQTLLIQVGGPLQNFFRQIVQGLTGMVQWFGSLSPTWQKIIIYGLGIVGMFLALTGVISLTIGLVLKVIAVWRDVRAAFILIRTIIMTSVIPSLRALGVALMTNPVFLIITALGLLVVAFIYCWKHFAGFRNFFKKAWKDIQGFFKGAWDVIKKVLSAVGNAFVTAYHAVANAVKAVLNFIKKHWKAIILVIGAILGPVTFVIAALVDIITTHFTAIKNFIVMIGKAIWTAIVFAWNLIKTAISAVIMVIKTIIMVQLRVLQTIIIGIWNGIVAVTRAVWGAIRAFFVGLWNAIKTIFIGALNVLKAIFGPVWDLIGGPLKAFWNGIVSFLSSIWDKITSAVSETWNTVVNIIGNIVGPVASAVGNVGTAIWNAIQGAAKTIWDAVTGIFDGIVDIFSGLYDQMLSVGKNIIIGIWNGITSLASWLWDKVSGFLSDLWDGITDFLGISSPSKKARDEIGKQISAGIAVGIGMGLKGMASAMTNAIIATTTAGILQTRKSEEIMKKSQEQFGRSIGLAVVRGLNKNTPAGVRAAQKLGALVQFAIRNKMTATVDIVKETMTNIGKFLADKMKTAMDNLQNIQDQYKNQRQAVVDTFQSGANFSGLGKGVDWQGNETPVTLKNMMKQFEDAAKRAQVFAARIAKLRKMGLDKELLKQLAEAGPEQAGAQVAALSNATRGQINAVNDSQAKLAAAGRKAGVQVAEEFYRTGIEAAKGIVKGIKDKEKDLIAIARRMGKSMVAAVKESLKISSPSRVMRDEVGAMMVRGLTNGIIRHKQTAVDAVRNMSKEMVAAHQGDLNTRVTATLADTYLGALKSAANRASAPAKVGHGFNVEHLEILNARPEKASDSLPKTIRKISYMSPGPSR